MSPFSWPRNLDQPFLGFKRAQYGPGRGVSIFGCPMDITSTYRSGVDKGPSEIRKSSDSIETYSPLLGLDLDDLELSDLGDLDLEKGSPSLCVDGIAWAIKEVFQGAGKFLCLGGEHTITLGIVQGLLETYPDLVIIHADAHTDLRDHYEGERINHATVMRRITEIVGPHGIYQFGVRSGTRAEFQFCSEHGTLRDLSDDDLRALISKLGRAPVYLSLDMDVMDPSCVPGVGNPEPGGWTYKDMERFLVFLRRLNLISADLVELNPGLDNAEVSSITAAKIARELTLILGRSNGSQAMADRGK